MPDFITSIFIGVVLASIGLKYGDNIILALVLVSSIFAFLTHMTGLSPGFRMTFWAVGLMLGVLAIARALYILNPWG